MRTRARSRIGVVLLFAFFCFTTQAQGDNSQAYWIHEDIVKPSMTSEYETVCKELTATLAEHEIPFNTIVTQTMDNRYMWVSPISGMEDIENDPTFRELADKMGADAMDALFDRMNKCYEIEQDYVIHLRKDLSYMPGGITQTPEGKGFRKFYYLHYNPSDSKALRNQMKAVKALFESKDSKVHYRVYQSGFGTRGAFYMVAVASANAGEDALMRDENRKRFGEEGEATMGKMFNMLRKYEEFSGYMRPDMLATGQ